MTDAQILAVGITVLAVLAGTLFSNSRITDLNGSLNRRIDDTRDILRAEMKAHFTSVDAKLDTLLKMLADMDARVTKLETR